MAVKIEFVVFWVVLCSMVVGYQCFEGLCNHHLQGWNGGDQTNQKAN